MLSDCLICVIRYYCTHSCTSSQNRKAEKVTPSTYWTCSCVLLQENVSRVPHVIRLMASDNVTMKAEIEFFKKVCVNPAALKADSVILGERLLIFELNSQSNYTSPFLAPVATRWLVGIVYGSVRDALLVSLFTEPGPEVFFSAPGSHLSFLFQRR